MKLTVGTHEVVINYTAVDGRTFEHREDVVIASDNAAVSASTESLVITPYPAIVKVAGNPNVQASTESLTITTNPTLISRDVDVLCSTADLTLTTFVASTRGDDVLCTTENLTITTIPAVVTSNTNVFCNTENLVLTSFPLMNNDVDVGVSTEQLTIAPQPATVESLGATTLTTQDITNIVDALFAKVVENGETFEQQLKLIRAEAAGKVAVSGNTVTFRDAADSTDRITATVDSNGQRTAIVTDVS